MWKENVFLFERNQTIASAKVSGDLHWCDADPGHDSHHHSTLGSILWPKGARDRPDAVSEERGFPALTMPLCGTVKTKPSQDLWAHVHGRQLQHTLRDGRTVRNAKEASHEVKEDASEFWVYSCLFQKFSNTGIVCKRTSKHTIFTLSNKSL